MKTHKLSIIGMFLGLGVSIYSVIRWNFLWPDPSQLALGVSIGLIICIFSYIYNWMKLKDEAMIKMDKRLDGFTDWWTKQELN